MRWQRGKVLRGEVRQRFRGHSEPRSSYSPTAKSRFTLQAGRHHQSRSGERPQPAVSARFGHASRVATAEAGYRDAGCQLWHCASRTGSGRANLSDDPGFYACGRDTRVVRLGEGGRRPLASQREVVGDSGSRSCSLGRCALCGAAPSVRHVLRHRSKKQHRSRRFCQ